MDVKAFAGEGLVADPTSSLGILLIVTTASATLLAWRSRRCAADVLEDLSECAACVAPMLQDTCSRLILNDDLAAAGLYDQAERSKFIWTQRLLPPAGAMTLAALLLVSAPNIPIPVAIASVVMGACAGYIAMGIRLRARQRVFGQALEFYLPVVMERLVMAVHSGFDVLASIRVVLEIEGALEHGRNVTSIYGGIDPVTRLLSIVYRLSNSGLGFEDALNRVAQMVACTAIRHAFVYLALAHRHGGELVSPLKELSDATQLYYQESLEEQVARMPVKATAPLLCTFTGLILCFLITPMIQIKNLSARGVAASGIEVRR